MNAMKKEVSKTTTPKQKLALARSGFANLVSQYKTFDAPANSKEIQAMISKIKNDLDSMSELGEMESLRLQMAMDRLSKLMTTLSNLLKKISDTANEITQNIK
jgi:uncharacterized protein YukE